MMFNLPIPQYFSYEFCNGKIPSLFIWLEWGIPYCKDTTNRSSYQDKASKIGGRLNQKPNVYSLLMLKVRFRGNLLQRTSQILTYRHVDRIFTFSIYPFKRNDKQIEEYRCKSFYSFQFIFLISIWKGTKECKSVFISAHIKQTFITMKKQNL